LATEFKHDKDGVKFTLEYPDTFQAGETKAEVEVLRAAGPKGLPVVTANVYRKDGESKPEEAIKRVMAVFESIGTGVELLGTEEVKTKDGTSGNKFEIEWMMGKTILTTNGLYTYKNGHVVSITVTHMDDPDDIMDIIDSLVFE
ncbi:MAG: hypothetical protein V3V52_07525, partial [Candidatus Adiutricales bacterium]